MKIPFKQRMDLARAIAVPFDIVKDLDMDETRTLTGILAEFLLLKCFDKDYNTSAQGIICEGILEILGSL